MPLPLPLPFDFQFVSKVCQFFFCSPLFGAAYKPGDQCIIGPGVYTVVYIFIELKKRETDASSKGGRLERICKQGKPCLLSVYMQYQHNNYSFQIQTTVATITVFERFSVFLLSYLNHLECV